jgi:hypothetical protein
MTPDLKNSVKIQPNSTKKVHDNAISQPDDYVFLLKNNVIIQIIQPDDNTKCKGRCNHPASLGVRSANKFR